MGLRNYRDLIVIFAFGAIGTFVLLYAEEFVFHHNAWCISGETHCVREWFSATSGWFAATIAGITGYFIYGQFRELKKQTAFALGFSTPTAVMFDPPEIRRIGELFENRLQITNWNRHPIYVHRLEMARDEGVAHLRVEVIEGGQTEAYQLGRLYIPGWADRSRAPHHALLNVILVGPDEAYEAGQPIRDRLEFTVQVHLTIIGETHQRITLRVHRPDAILA